jgi:hypothetical protein
MSDVQIAIIDQENIEVNLAVPGIQGAKGDTGTVAAAGDGTAAAPGISFASDTDTGIYRVGSNSIGISTGGTGRLFVDADGTTRIENSAVNGSPLFRISTFNGFAEINSKRSTGGSYSQLRGTYVGNATDYWQIGSNGFTDGTFAIWAGANALERARIRADGMFEVKGAGTAGVSPAFSVSGGAPANSLVILPTTGYVGLGTASPAVNLNVVSAGDTAISSASTGTIQSARVQIIGRQTSADSEWNIVSAGSGLGSAALRFVRGTWTNTPSMLIDSSGRVGIGNASPGQLLAIATATNDDGIILTNSSANGGRIRIDSTGTGGRQYHINVTANGSGAGGGKFVIRDNTASDAARLTIDSTGNVGIGTASPSTKFEVIDTNTIIKSSSTSGYAAFYANAATGNAAYYFFAINGTEHARISATNNDLIFGNGSTGLEKARIDSSGRLLVGTNTYVQTNTYTSSNLFNIAGNSGVGPQLSTYSNDAFALGIDFSKSRGATVGTQTSVSNGDALGSLIFNGYDSAAYKQAASIQAAVDGAPGSTIMPGRLVFSTNSGTAGASPTEKLKIDKAGLITCSNGVNNMFVVNTAASGTSNYFFQGYNLPDVAPKIVLWNNGNVVNTNNSYGTLSDIKLKENIVDANSQWNDLKALRVRNFNLKAETGHETHTQIGLVAQEVELVSPGLVIESPDYDKDGNDLGTVTKSVSYSVLYMKAVKALQEAMERIETLEAKVAALEAQ